MAKPIKRRELSYIKIEPRLQYGWSLGESRRIAAKEEWRRDIEAFIADSREQSANCDIEAIYDDRIICSACQRDWDVYEGNCAGCGSAIEESEADQCQP